jgi:CBS domain-containing protein
MMTISELMTCPVEAISPNATVQVAAERMRAQAVGCLVVMEDGQPVGMITDRDITVRATARGALPFELRVREAMTVGVVTCRSGDPLSEAERIMVEHGIRRLLVVDPARRAVGLISLDDLATAPEEARLPSEVLTGSGAR